MNSKFAGFHMKWKIPQAVRILRIAHTHVVYLYPLIFDSLSFPQKKKKCNSSSGFLKNDSPTTTVRREIFQISRVTNVDFEFDRKRSLLFNFERVNQQQRGGWGGGEKKWKNNFLDVSSIFYLPAAQSTICTTISFIFTFGGRGRLFFFPIHIYICTIIVIRVCIYIYFCYYRSGCNNIGYCVCI